MSQAAGGSDLVTDTLPPRTASRPGAPRPALAIDRLGAVIAALALIALLALPFVAFKPNRILSGKGVGFLEALPLAVALGGGLIIIAAAVLALLRIRPWQRLGVASVALVALALLVGAVPGHLVPAGNALARVSPSSGFWLLLFAFAILFADATARLALGPLQRVAMLALALLVIGLILHSGLWDGLSVMREYAINADSFWQEGRSHLALAIGSLAAALVVGLPLGIACHRSATLQGILLPVLNIVQTIPSIAMYGLMMGPLALLVAALPVLSDFGIRGIGTAPAAIALFLYSLLPVVANTVVGLQSVPAQAVDAARGMGMTDGQRLFKVELPIALPVILTGVRIVLVQNIGLVTIAALIGGGGFGTYVFRGIGQAAIDFVLLGAAPTVALAFAAAILLDAVIDLLKGRRA